jgi:hypothetical protein
MRIECEHWLALATKQQSEPRSDLCLCWRLESERVPLVRPLHRKINETFETEASRQTSFDRRLHDIRGKKGGIPPAKAA